MLKGTISFEEYEPDDFFAVGQCKVQTRDETKKEELQIKKAEQESKKEEKELEKKEKEKEKNKKNMTSNILIKLYFLIVV